MSQLETLLWRDDLIEERTSERTGGIYVAAPSGGRLCRTTATVDRLLHYADVCQTTGDSVHLTQALAGKGVRPLT